MGGLACWGLAPALAGARGPQDQAEDRPPEEPRQIPEISDEPKFIDPIQFMPPQLAAIKSVDLRASSAAEMVEWLRRETGLTVLVRQRELENDGVHLADPYSDSLDEAPIYLLLDRLHWIGLGWYFERDVLYLTTQTDLQDRGVNVPYDLGDLLDAGYHAVEVAQLIEQTIEPMSWESNGGPSNRVDVVGDMLFVRTNDAIQRKVQSLLSILGQPARRTFVHMPAADMQLREALTKSLSIDYRDTPLEEVVRDLAEQSGADIRLDREALRNKRIRERQPIRLSIQDRSLETILNYMFGELDLAWMIRDGVLWITEHETAEDSRLTAVYDVRDLCADSRESAALANAIQSQMPYVWESDGGISVLAFGQPGTMVVWALGETHDRLLDLLEKYRQALRMSKLRAPTEAVDPQKTLYYRLHANVADDLFQQLPRLVSPESWQTDQQPDAIGTIFVLESPAEIQQLKSGEQNWQRIAERKILRVHQRQSIHDQIKELLQRVEAGDQAAKERTSPAVMGGGMGGFGGGYFALPIPGQPSPPR